MARATATVLFTDIVDSTALTVAHGEAYDAARRAHDALLRDAVESHGGRVVKGLGDGVMATFPGVLDGVAAARAAQQAMHRLRVRRPEPALAIRAGLAVGDVTWEGDDCFGEPVIAAARLCAKAGAGQILAAAVVQALAGGDRAEGFRPAGSMELKGLPGPVDVVEVRYEQPSATPVPLPAALATEPTAFVGRADELDRLHRALREVDEQHERQLVVVEGEPGVGKTSVVAQAARVWFDGGATVAMGRCEEDVRAPYRPFAAALDHLVAHADLELLEKHAARYGAAILPLAPRLAERVDDLPAAEPTDLESERFLLLAAAGDLLALLSERAPLVLVLDDLHWADAGTASLLRSITTAAEPARLLVVGTLRADELDPQEPMGQAMASFSRVPSATRLPLGGLGSDDVAELVDRSRGPGSDGGPGLVDDLLEQTDGNAFLVTEVIRHLADTGQLAQLTGPAGRLVPDSVRAFLGGRVARLGPGAGDVLAAAAVIGSEFPIVLLAAATGTPEADVLTVLEQATAAALVREVADGPGRFAFTHALVQHAVLAGLGATREASLHRRVAELLEDDGHDAGVSVARLAHHWFQAVSVSDNIRARDWAVHAGDDALAGLAPGDALVFYRQALLLHDRAGADDEALRIDLLTKLGTAERQAGDPEHRDTLLKASRLARRASDGPRLAAAALANHSGTFARFRGVDVDRVEVLEDAILGTTDSATRTLLLGTLANELTYSGDWARRRQLADDALGAARSLGDPTLLLRVINLVFYALWIPDTLDERLALSAESERLVADVTDPVARYWAATSSTLNRMQAGRFADGTAALEQMHSLADHLSQPALQWRAQHTEACRLLLAGDADGAAPLAEAAFELGELARGPESAIYFKTQQMTIAWQRGELRQLAGNINGTSPRPPNAVASLCLIFAEGGREAEATALLDRGAASGFADLTVDPSYITCLAYYAVGASRLGHHDAAAVLHALLLPYAGQVGFDGVATVGSIEHHLGRLAGVLGRRDEAGERLGRAVALHERIGSTFFADCSRQALASI